MFLIETTFGDLSIGQHFCDKTYGNHFVKIDEMTAYNFTNGTIIHPILIWVIKPLDKNERVCYNIDTK